MGITKKEMPDVKDSYGCGGGAKKTQLHPTVHTMQAKKEQRHNLQRKIVRMFSSDRYI